MALKIRGQKHQGMLNEWMTLARSHAACFTV